MLTPIDLHAKHAVGFAVDGTLTAADLERVTAAIDAAAADHGTARLYVELRSLPSLEGVSEIVRAIRAKSAGIAKVEKYAIVTDKGWIAPLTKVAGYALPSMELHVFPLTEADVAQTWLVNDEPAPAPPASIEPVEFFDDPSVVALAVTGKLRKPDYEIFNALVDARPEATSLYVEIREVKGLEVRAIVDELQSDAKVLSRFEKCALVGHRGWLSATATVADWLTPGLDVKYFDVTDAAGARLWLGVRKHRERGAAGG